MDVLRWGRSAYETDEGLALESAKVRLLGAKWSLQSDIATSLLQRADVLVVNSGVRVDAEVLAKTQCQLVLTTTSGFDHIDREACRQGKVIVARCPLARRDAVVEHALTAMMWLRRRLSAIQSTAESGRWGRGDLPDLRPAGLAGSNVAIVGHGVIGQKISSILTELGARVLIVDPQSSKKDVENVTLEEAAAHADILSLHCSLNNETHGVFSKAYLHSLRPGAIVVNTARGPLLDVQAAATLVHHGHLGGLAVDVFPIEPYPSLSEMVHPQVLLSPHASGYTRDLAQNVSNEVFSTLSCWIQGKPLPHLVV